MLSGQNEKIEVVLSCVIHLLCRQTEHMLIFLDAQAVRKIVWCNSLTLTPTRCPKGRGCVCADVCLACRIMASRGSLGDAEGLEGVGGEGEEQEDRRFIVKWEVSSSGVMTSSPLIWWIPPRAEAPATRLSINLTFPLEVDTLWLELLRYLSCYSTIYILPNVFILNVHNHAELFSIYIPAVVLMISSVSSAWSSLHRGSAKDD